MTFASLNGGATALISSYLMNVQGVLTAPLFNDCHVLRLQPPLVAERAEIDRALTALTAACDILHRRDYQALVRHLVAPSRVLDQEPELAPNPQVARKRAAMTKQTNRFAFLVHYTEEEDIFRSDPSFRQFDEGELNAVAGLGKAARPRIRPPA
jgi:hypothetical protein